MGHACSRPGYTAYLLGLLLIGSAQVRPRRRTPHVGDLNGILLGAGSLPSWDRSSPAWSACCCGCAVPTAWPATARPVTAGAASIGWRTARPDRRAGPQRREQSWWSSMPLSWPTRSCSCCIAVAVLRYRLYDVEVILSGPWCWRPRPRSSPSPTWVIVVVLGRSAQDRTDGGFWQSLLLTVVVALAFQPLRRRVVRFADRLVYGSRAAPYDALADFSQRIGQSPAPAPCCRRSPRRLQATSCTPSARWSASTSREALT